MYSLHWDIQVALIVFLVFMKKRGAIRIATFIFVVNYNHGHYHSQSQVSIENDTGPTGDYSVFRGRSTLLHILIPRGTGVALQLSCRTALFIDILGESGMGVGPRQQTEILKII